jgi:hypothetical protein
MVINELLSSRKWKGVKVWQGIACRHPQNSITSKILQSEKFCSWWSKGRTRKIWPPGHPRKNQAGQKKKERHQGAASKSLPPTEFGAKTQNFKSVEVKTNYGG